MTNQSPDWLPSWFKDGVAPLLAIIVIVLGFVTIWIYPELKTEVSMMMTIILTYYYGSSKSSQEKDKTISTALEKKEGQ